MGFQNLLRLLKGRAGCSNIVNEQDTFVGAIFN